MKLSSATAERETRLDQLFGALSDRTRRALLAQLALGPAKVTDLAEPFDMSLPAVSKHLKVLERAGLVQRAIDGRVHRCSLHAAPLLGVEEWVSYYRAFWEENLDCLQQFLEEDK